MFRFTHKDGRTGTGHTVWRAILAALGAACALELPLLEDPVWTSDGVTLDEATDREIYKTAPVIISDTSEQIGTLFAMRD